MRFTKFQKIIVFAIAVLAFVSVLGAFFQASQRTVNMASAKQGPGQNQRGTKRQWSWLSAPPPFLELIETRNLDNDNWMMDLEIKLKNKSEKSICYIDFVVWVPDLKTQPDVMVNVHFEFGNRDLWDKDKPSADDKFLKPGEEIVLTVKESRKRSLRKLFEHAVPQKGSLSESMLKLEFYFHQTVFEDGTKYIGKQLISGGNKDQSTNVPKQSEAMPATLLASLPFSEFGLFNAKKKT